MSNNHNKSQSSGKVTYGDSSMSNPGFDPREIQMNEQGQLIDKKGNVIHIETKGQKNNKSNARKMRNLQRRQQFKQKKFKNNSEFYDPDLEDNASKRRNRRKIMGLHFSEPGSHIKRAEMIRNRQMSKKEEEKKTEAPPPPTETKIDAKAELLRRIDKLKPLDPLPDVEWWDAKLLPEGVKTFSVGDPNKEGFKITEEDFNSSKCTNLIHHPIPTKNP